jgi:hypothetical protein
MFTKIYNDSYQKFTGMNTFTLLIINNEHTVNKKLFNDRCLLIKQQITPLNVFKY